LAFAPRPNTRLVFQLIGPTEIGVVLPLTKRVEYFPSGADVTVIGCFAGNQISSWPGYVDALMVIVESDPPVTYMREPMPELACPLPEPK
ncbi:MAG: hypothetical protein L0287_21805, partial [Anaerolineae bacterium]|nr:hypothetical protein [Anaerolineae bacterium]